MGASRGRPDPVERLSRRAGGARAGGVAAGVPGEHKGRAAGGEETGETTAGRAACRGRGVVREQRARGWRSEQAKAPELMS